MPDIFRARVEFETRTDNDVWQTAEYLLAYLERTLSGLDGRLSASDVALVDREDSSLERPSVAQVRAAAREHHLVPVRLSVSMRYWRNPGEANADAAPVGRTTLNAELAMSPDAELWIWATFKANWNNLAHLRIGVESSDKILADGLAAKLAAERDFIARSGVPNTDTADADGPSRGDSTGTSDKTNRAQGVTDETQATTAAGQAWIVRTWRDHTATFVVTVLGTVAAAAIALWIGLTP